MASALLAKWLKRIPLANPPSPLSIPQWQSTVRKTILSHAFYFHAILHSLIYPMTAPHLHCEPIISLLSLLHTILSLRLCLFTLLLRVSLRLFITAQSLQVHQLHQFMSVSGVFSRHRCQQADTEVLHWSGL